ncbi:putative olfactory receptor 14L1 [Elephas maximus indicus]|uniref:putative olfactory receptor 14L1 n=1 Tax=Elephas maximus indicus TaxID=99487 RepID=UPI002116BAE0|nr:putative olfactory receptor 14L1 [Elephas maximus indicus]
MEMISHTAVTEFLLLVFSTDPGMQNRHGVLFLMAYLAALTGNGLIIFLITCHPQFHTPMYFFLKNLSFIDFCYISITAPNFVVNSDAQELNILPWVCFADFFFIVFACSELAILTVMSYDHYVAICRPLLSEVIMSSGACGQMIALCEHAQVEMISHTAVTEFLLLGFSTDPGMQNLHVFVCAALAILTVMSYDRYVAICRPLHYEVIMSNSKLNLGEIGIIALIFSASLVCFVFIAYSYVHIFPIVRRISSSEGRNKALSTCTPHLVVVTLFILTASLDHLKPPSNLRSIELSVFYTVLPPTLNPIIYSHRNKEMKVALGKVLGMEVFKSN